MCVCSIMPGIVRSRKYLNCYLQCKEQKGFFVASAENRRFWPRTLGVLDDKNSARLSQIFFCGPNNPLSLGGKIAGGRFLVNAARGRCLRRRWRLADRRIVTREDRVHGRGVSCAYVPEAFVGSTGPVSKSVVYGLATHASSV